MNLFPGKTFAGGMSNGDRRIEMGTGDVTEGVNEHHHNKSPHN